MIQVSTIYEEVKEVTGLCEQSQNLTALTRAVELLSNEGLFDPQIGTLNFSNNGNLIVALPRDVKTVLRATINKVPTFFRNRLFEYTQNSNGSDDGEEIGYNHHDRGYSAIQDETKLPGKLAYVVESAADVGKAITVTGSGIDGRQISETLTGGLTPAYGELEFYEVKQVVRDATTRMTTLLCNLGALIAQYYPDETVPWYRCIKLSKSVASVRILFRREVFDIKTLEDVIPLHSKMAVIHATKAVRYFANDAIDKAQASLALAIDFLKKEQQSRDEGDAMAAAMEKPSVIDNTMNASDGVIVADVYPMASDIFGPIGRPRIFDRITVAVAVLSNKASWDAGLGVVDLWTPDNQLEYATDRAGRGHGYFVLPRFVATVVSLNFCGRPTIPRNRWFEFHLNGTGEMGRASHGAWDDAGETVISRWMPVDSETRRVTPVRVVALPNSELDNGKSVIIYGKELLGGRIVDVIRGGKRGWKVPCRNDDINFRPGYVNGSYDAPWFVEFERIVREPTNDFVSLICVKDRGDTQTYDATGVELGYWYPDEIEPRYRAIKVSSSKSKRIRILYRKRTTKITSLYEPIHLRSHLAIETMFRAIKAQETDLAAAQALETMAVGYLSEERINSGPSDTGSLQFDEGTMPGFTGNIT